MLLTSLPFDYAVLLDSGDRVRSKRPRPSGYTNLIPITSPFFQAILQALPGDERSSFS